MAKKQRTRRKLSWKEALGGHCPAMIVSLARQMLTPSYDMSIIPDYDGTSAYAVTSGNQPSFTEDEYTTDSDEYYSELDSLGPLRRRRKACVGVEPDAHRKSGRASAR